MTQFFEVNGNRVVSGSITIPMFGTWVADLLLANVDGTAAPGTAAAITLGSLTLQGTISRSAGFTGSRSMRVIGGAAGWRNSISGKGYNLPFGITLSMVLKDAASAAGEQISVPFTSDRSLGANFCRRAGRAKKLLDVLTDGQWWVDTNGVTQITARPSTSIASPFTVLDYSGGKGRFKIATEFFQDWMPGRTFTSPVITDPQTISSVTFEAKDGKIDTIVLNTPSAEDRLRQDILGLIDEELETLKYAAVWEYKVAPNPIALGLTSALDLTAVDPSMPNISGVPLASELGVVSPPSAGTTARVRFVNCDPSRPEVFALGATTEHVMTAEATALLIYNVLVVLMSTAGGGPLLAAVLQPLIMPAITAALAAQAVPAPPGLVAQTATATALAASMAAGTTPSSTSLPFNSAIAALSSKILDVSGDFPSLGIPGSS